MITIIHKCNECGAEHSSDENCLCRECVERFNEVSFERGKEEGYKEGYEAGSDYKDKQ